MTARGPIRVLHLRDSPWVDGPGRTILETAARIDRSRIDYTIAPLVPDDGAKHPLVVAARERGVPVQPVTDTGALAPLVEHVTELVDRLGTEILHSSEFRTNLVALRCRRLRPSLKIVSTAHGWIANDTRGTLKSYVDRALLGRFDRVILVSHAMRRCLPNWLVSERRIRVIQNALPLDSYGLGFVARRRGDGAADGHINLLVVGRLAPEKGVDLLLRAIALLAGEYPDVRLLIAGVGPCEPSLRASAERLGLADKVRWLGYVTDMTALYSQTDLVVQSSVTEGMPNVMLEAAYLGVPVVATDVGGTREVIEHEVGGWLVPARSVRALAAGIREYLRRPQEFAAMARRGRQKIVGQFSFEARTARQSAVYEELMDRSA